MRSFLRFKSVPRYLVYFNILLLVLDGFMVQEFIVGRIKTINDTLARNFNDMISDRLDELVVVRSEDQRTLKVDQRII